MDKTEMIDNILENDDEKYSYESLKSLKKPDLEKILIPLFKKRLVENGVCKKGDLDEYYSVDELNNYFLESDGANLFPNGKDEDTENNYTY